MKKEIGLLFLVLLLASCESQKKVISNENLCKVTVVPSSEDFGSFYRGIDSTDFFKNELANFNNLNEGVLYYKRQDGLPNGSFFVLNIDDDYCASHEGINFNKDTKVSLEDKNKLNKILRLLKTEDYYQSCSKDLGHVTIHLLMIKSKDKKVQCFSFNGFPSQVEISNENFKLTQQVFDIIIRNFYKK